MSALGLALDIPPLGGGLFDDMARADGALIALRMDGSPMLNYGTLAGLTITPTNLTFSPSDIPALGGNMATFDATTSILTIANNAGFASLTAFTVIQIAKATSSGENSRGRLFQMDLGATDVAILNVNNNGVPVQVEARVNRTVNSLYTSAGNEIAFPTGAMMWGMTYDETAGITLSKAYLNVFGEITGGVRVIGSGATAAFSAPINIGNNSGAARTWNGTIYRFLLFPTVLSIARQGQYAQAAGVAA